MFVENDERYMILTTDQKVRGSTPFGCTLYCGTFN